MFIFVMAFGKLFGEKSVNIISTLNINVGNRSNFHS